MTLAPDTLFAAYRIETLLGRGGMGEVYRATDGRLGRPVALKLVAPELAGAPGVRERFLAESRLAASLDHPHIVPIYEAGEADGRLFLAMRYVDGSDLGALLERDGRLAPERAVTLLRGIAEALDAAHDRGLVHRDVKPSNILVARTGRGDEHAYLADFGLVKQLGSGGGFTQSGQLLGSVDYVAPEQIEGRPIDARVDVYSLGCVLYAALSGEVPFPRDTDMATLWAHVQTAPPRPSAVDPALGPFDALLARALAKDPADRPASAGELLALATVALDGTPPPIAASTGQADVELPYVGLRAFDEADARFFVGREDDVAALLERLRNGRFLAVFGPSGSGKSSLVRAGLVPALRRGELDGSEAWPIEIVRPGSLPVETLAARIARQRPDASMGALVDELTTDSRAIHHATEVALVDAPRAARAVWVIDQAEELFTLTTDESARRAAIEALVHAATVAGGRTVVVLAMRADFYHRCATYPALAAAVADSQYLVSPLSTEALRRTIEEPARLVGLDLEPGLVETILDDVAERPGALPLLEHALVELWERRRGTTLTLAAYHEAGGIEGAIAVRAEATYGRLAPDEAELVRGIFLRLVQPGEGTEDTRRRASLAELGSTAAAATRRVVDLLTDARLITVAVSDTGPDPVVDIAHEALLRAWPRLRGWIDTDREALRTARRIADATAEWERLGREHEALLQGARLAEATEFIGTHGELLADTERGFVEQSIGERDRQVQARGRRQRVGLGVAAALVLFFVALSGVALSLWAGSQASERNAVSARTDAETQAAAAESRRIEALGRQLLAQSLANRSQMPTALLLALEGLERDESEEAWTNLAELLQYTPQTVARYELDELGVPGEMGYMGIADLAVSTDGSRLAGLISRCDDEETCTTLVADLWIWDTEAWRPMHGPIEARLPESPWGRDESRLAFAPDGDRVVFPATDGLAVLRLDNGVVSLLPAPTSGELASVAWVPGGNVVRWIEPQLPGSPRLWTWDPGTDVVTSVDLLPSQELPNGFSTSGALLSRSGRWAVTVNQRFEDDAEAYRSELFDASSGASVGSIPTDVLGFASTGAFLIARDADLIRVHTLPDLVPVGSSVRATAVWADVSADGTELILQEGASTVAAFELATGSAISVARPTARSPGQFAAGPGSIRYVSSDFGDIEVLDVQRDSGLSTTVAPVPEPLAGSVNVVLSGDGARLASWINNPFEPARTVTVSDLASGIIGEVRPDDPGGIRQARLDEDGSTLFTLHDSGRLIRTPVMGGAATTMATFDMSSSEGYPRSLVVSASEGLAAVVHEDRTQVLTASGEIVIVPIGGDSSAALSPDGRSVVVSSCIENRIRVVSLVEGIVTSDRSVDDCSSATDINREGSRALSMGATQTGSSVDIYDPATWERRGFLSADTEEIIAASFEAATSDATVITIGTTVRRWDVSPAAWRARACRIAGRNLHRFEWSRYLGDEPYRPTCPDLPYAAEPLAVPSLTPSPSPTPTPAGSGTSGEPRLCEAGAGNICYLPLPGHYSGGSFSPAISFDLGEGWYQQPVRPSVIALARGEAQYLSLIRGVTSVYDDDGIATTIDGTPEAFLEWLRGRRGVRVEAERPATLAGLPATEVDLSIPTFTNMFQPLQGGPWFAEDDASWRIRIVALDPVTTLMVIVESPADTFEAFWDETAERVVESIVLE